MGSLRSSQVRFGAGVGCCPGLAQCVEVYTMAQLRGWTDSSIWPLTPASVPARTEGGPLGISGPVPSRGTHNGAVIRQGSRGKWTCGNRILLNERKKQKGHDGWALRLPEAQKGPGLSLGSW